MLVTVSTVLDTLPNTQRFVQRNLAGGVDHLLVFLDGPDEQVSAWLDEHPHVTAVPAHGAWWPEGRPATLNDRQRLNANLGRALMAVLDPDGWVFHIDSDEVVQIDREQLAALGADVTVVWLEPVEAVSRPRWEHDVTHFKTFLDDDDLDLLATLGVLTEPDNGEYFRGHVDGKSGMRPRLDHWHIVHRVTGPDKKVVEGHRAPWARVLHYESHSGEEFVRKWTAKFEAGPNPRTKFRPGRRRTANALRTLITKDLAPEAAERYLTTIYERTRMDDFTTLHELGMLEEIDPDAGTHSPELLDDRRAAALQQMLTSLAGQPKRPFHPGRPARRAAAVMQRLADEVGLPGPAAPTAPDPAPAATDAPEAPDAPASPPSGPSRWRRALDPRRARP